MNIKSAFSTFSGWLKSTEIFARPSKQLPGKWQLFEYYVDRGDDLLNFKEDELKKNKESWAIEFSENGQFIQAGNVSVDLIARIGNGIWSISRNFVTVIHPTNFRNNVEFQFAIAKKQLKLLKKDAFGKIEFFGFFKRLE